MLIYTVHIFLRICRRAFYKMCYGRSILGKVTSFLNALAKL